MRRPIAEGGPPAAALMLAAALAFFVGGPTRADRFIDDDDYKDGEEVVGTFLTDEDYGKLHDEVTRNSVEFDWTWVLTPTAAERVSVEEPRERRGFLGRLRGSGNRSPRPDASTLAFDLRAFGTLRVPRVQFDAGLEPPGFTEKVREIFWQVARQLGLEVVDGGPADLELGIAVVDFNSDGLYGIPFVGRVLPWVELEIRLVDLTTGRKLLLIRHQEHASEPIDAVRDAASDLLKFLR